jgi:hypothetical protein
MPARPQWLIDELSISSIPGQTAEALCSSETSWGEDFIGVDGMYCDMETKQLSPLCSTQGVDGCVEISETEGTDATVVKRTSVARRELQAAHKSYKKVVHTHL